MKLYSKEHDNYNSYKVTGLTITKEGNQRLNFISTRAPFKVFLYNAEKKHNDLFNDARENEEEFHMFHEIMKTILGSIEEKTFTYCFVEEPVDKSGTLILTETGRVVGEKYQGSQTILQEGDNKQFKEIDEKSKHIFLCTHSKNTVICAGILKMSKMDSEQYELVVDFMSGSYQPPRDNFNILINTLYHASGGLDDRHVTIKPIYSYVKCKDDKPGSYCQRERGKYCQLMTQSPDYSKICNSGGKKTRKGKKNKKSRKVKKTMKKRRKTKKTKKN